MQNDIVKQPNTTEPAHQPAGAELPQALQPLPAKLDEVKSVSDNPDIVGENQAKDETSNLPNTNNTQPPKKPKSSSTTSVVLTAIAAFIVLASVAIYLQMS